MIACHSTPTQAPMRESRSRRQHTTAHKGNVHYGLQLDAPDTESCVFGVGVVSAGDMSVSVGERLIVDPTKSQFGWYCFCLGFRF